MFWITLIIHIIVSGAVAGVAVTVALVAGVTSKLVLVGLAAAGMVVTWPVSSRIARTLFGP